MKLAFLPDNVQWMRRRYSGVVIDLKSAEAQYFAIPKVACSSIMSSLVDVLGIGFPKSEWRPELFQTNKWDHLFERSSTVLYKRQAFRVPNRWRFAFVRNPWDRLVSCYSEKIRDDGDPENFTDGVSNLLLPFQRFRRGMSFQQFAWEAISIPDKEADPHWRSQHTFLTTLSGQVGVDFIGRFERIDTDMGVVSSKIGYSLMLPHLLASTRKPYQHYYSAELKAAVGQRYEKDIKLFGYEF